MRKYLLIVIGLIGLLSITSPAQAVVSLVSVSTSTPTASVSASTVVTSTLSVQAGNLLLLTCSHGSTFVAPTNATDTIGNIFTQFGNTSDTDSGALTGYYAISSSTLANDIISCNFASSVAFRTAIASQYSGILTSSPFDVGAVSGSNSATTPQGAGPFTTNFPNELIVGMSLTENAPIAAGTGYTLVGHTPGGSPNDLANEYRITTSTVTASTTFSSAGGGFLIIGGTFKVAPDPTHLLRGSGKTRNNASR